MATQPKTTCGACGGTDDHPKHQVAVGYNNEHTGGAMFHPDDDDRDGVVNYHFDCPTEWHSRVHPEHHQRLAALANSGVRGAALRARIETGDI